MPEIIEIVKSFDGTSQFFILLGAIWAIVAISKAAFHYSCVVLYGWPPIQVDDLDDDELKEEDDDC